MRTGCEREGILLWMVKGPGDEMLMRCWTIPGDAHVSGGDDKGKLRRVIITGQVPSEEMENFKKCQSVCPDEFSRGPSADTIRSVNSSFVHIFLRLANMVPTAI